MPNRLFDSYYRTIVELKLRSRFRRCRRSGVIIEPLWNWNTLIARSNISSSCYYRTIVELKLLSIPQRQYLATVIIEPLWNWNIFLTSLLSIAVWLLSNHCGIETCIANYVRYACKVLLSNHCGIETGVGWWSLTCKICYYRTIVELKLRYAWKLFRLSVVIIEPLWNWNMFCW